MYQVAQIAYNPEKFEAVRIKWVSKDKLTYFVETLDSARCYTINLARLRPIATK